MERTRRERVFISRRPEPALSTKSMFHDESRPSKVPGVCDGCGGALAQREDDNKETILKRLEVYQKSTAPLKEFYKKQGTLKTVTARGPVEEVFSSVCEMVQ